MLIQKLIKSMRRQLMVCAITVSTLPFTPLIAGEIGKEVAIPRHLQDGEEYSKSIKYLLRYGETLFSAVWTDQEGGGRPFSTGSGAPLADPTSPLVFPRNANRISAPDANSCAGCHNQPFGIPGGGGDIVANVFVLGQRFDFATFDLNDSIPTRGAVDENGNHVTLDTIGNSRNTLGMFGSGYIEMLARQISGDLEAIRDAIPAGGFAALESKGINFGTLARNDDGSWDTSGVEGLPAPSLKSTRADDPPNLIVRPFHQAGAVISVRQFTVNAYNHHHGIQATERFGANTDPDGDGYENEMTEADVTAATLYQITLAPPGQVLPRSPEARKAAKKGMKRFKEIGCADCHIPALPLDNEGWIYTEPNPYNPPGTRSTGRQVKVDLTSDSLPGPRLKPEDGIVWVPAFTDFKLHDITEGPDDPNREPLDMHEPAGSPGFFAGNGKFLTRKLWGTANEPPYFHHGKFTTLRQAVEAHRGDALDSYNRWAALSDYERDTIIEFLKTLQVLPPGSD